MQMLEQFASVGARNYYRYLEQSGKGREIITVNRIARVDQAYHIFLSKNPFSTDAVTFLIEGTEYSQKQLLIYEHDRDRRVIFVRAVEGNTDPFLNVMAKHIQVVADLKFLVRRVQEWYERNPDSLRFPCPAPSFHIRDFIQPDLSTDQQIAVRNALTYAPSYIWGAPGTGKTRYVLSECLLQYCHTGQQVVVLAPTNNAIEQVLYGVLEKLSTYGIPLTDVIRLGTPSMKFAERYAEICEVQGVEKRLGELTGQIRFWQSIVDHREFLKRLSFAEEEIIPSFDSVEQLLVDIGEERKLLLSTAASVSNAERLVQSCRNEHLLASRLTSEQRKHMQTLGYRIGKVFFGSVEQAAAEKLSQLESTELAALRHLEEAEAALVQAKQDKDALISKLKMLDQTIDKRLASLSKKLSSIPDFQEINTALNRNTLELCRSKVLEKIELGHACRIQKLEEYREYQDIADEEIQSRIAELNVQYAIIAAQTTEERLKHVKIVAATIDTFLFRFQPAKHDEQEDPILFRHIFLDEAGYCSLAKALALFGFDRPVTMFGDHMQLPPVCEADDSMLKKQDMEGAFLFAQSALYVEDAFLCSNNPTWLLKQYLQHDMPIFREMQKSDLRETYRFGELLASALEKCVYRNGFCSANPEAPFTIEVLAAPRMPGHARRQSPAEAEAIQQRLEILGTDDYAILTPYKNQVQLLSQTIPQAREEQRIMTIHASQGREWDTVFLSVVDTSDMFFTDSTKPEIGGLQIINTAVSRAKARLIIVCDVAFWRRKEGQMITTLIFSVH